jgi:subtilase family serine protease
LQIQQSSIINPDMAVGILEAGNYAGQADLDVFNQAFGLPSANIQTIFGTNMQAQCSNISSAYAACTEGSADAQYITAIAQNIPLCKFKQTYNDTV